MARRVEQSAPHWLGPGGLLTGAVAELKAQVRASEVVDGDGKLEELRPPRTVAVIEHKTAVVHKSRFTTTLDDTVLQRSAERSRKREGHGKEIEKEKKRGENKSEK